MIIAISQTRDALKINDEQAEKTTLPVIVFDVVINDWKAFPIIRNVGLGPAFNIQVHEYKNKEYTAVFKTITGLEKDGKCNLDYYIDDYEAGEKSFKKYVQDTDTLRNYFYEFITYQGYHFMGRIPNVPFDSSVVITYFDIKGNKYEISETIGFDLLKKEFSYLIENFPRKLK